MFSSTTLFALVGSASASILWDGRLNAYSSSAFLDDWSFSNEVGPYQYYIHGTGNVSEYVDLGTAYKNPADSGSKQGIQITIDNSSVWNNDGMLRTELIPQTTAAINAGKVFYHFSMQHTGANPPSAYEEHQVCFFESHFTEMKYGLIDGESGTSDTSLRWEVNSESKWNVTFEPNVWHNIAYAIDFDAGSVAFYHSTGADDLKLTVAAVSVSASSNGADWHLGVLRLPSTTGRTDTAAEDWHFSGVYIESGSLTTSVAGPGGASSSDSSSSAASSSTTSVKPTSTVAVQSSSTVISTSTSKAVPTSATKSSPSSKPVSTSSIAPTTLKTAVKSSASAPAPDSTSLPKTLSTSSSTRTHTSVSKPATTTTTTTPKAASSIASSSTFDLASATLTEPSSYGTLALTYSLSTPTPSSIGVTVAPVSSSSSATKAVSAETSSTHAHHPHHSHHHKASSSSASTPTSDIVAPVSTGSAGEGGDCVVKYVYV